MKRSMLVGFCLMMIIFLTIYLKINSQNIPHIPAASPQTGRQMAQPIKMPLNYPVPPQYQSMQKAMAQMNEGDLQINNSAPNAVLISVDSQESFYLKEKFSARPLVLMFGSFT